MTSPELTDHAVKTAISELPKVFRYLWGIAQEFASERDFLNYAKKYRSSLEENYSFMQILGMEQSVPLDSIYTEVRVITRVVSREYKSVEELEQELRFRLETVGLEDIYNKVSKDLEDQLRHRSIGLLLELLERDHHERIKEVNEEEVAEISRILSMGLSKDKSNEYIDDVRSQYNRRRLILADEFNSRVHNTREEAFAEPLTSEQELEINEKLPATIELEIERQVQRELNSVVLSDFDSVMQRKSEGKLPAWPAIAQRDRVVVLGKPGAGKTTFLKHILLRQLRSIDETPRLPVYISLKEISDKQNTNLLDAIVDEFDTCGFPNARPFVERLLRSSNRILVLFDGLDEVPTGERRELIKQVFRLSKKYRLNQYIVACRTAAYQGQLEGFSEVEIADFGPEQVGNFVKGWFQKTPRLAHRFLKDLKLHPGLHELTTTPLLLALLCIAYKRNQKFPEQKAVLYLSCIDALFIDWDASRQIRRDNFVDKFDVESKKWLLGKVACDTFCEEVQFFSETELIERFDTCSVALPIPPKNGHLILKEYSHHHGLLVERARDIFSFSHLTLHEFFTALHLSKTPSLEVFENLANEAWKEHRWNEVVVFLGCLLPRADTLLSAYPINSAARKAMRAHAKWRKAR